VSDYAQDARDADLAFREDGQLITLTRNTPGAYVDGSIVSTTSTQTVWGIETGVTLRDLGLGNTNGTLIQAGDRKLIVSTLADDGSALVVPQVDDLALVGTKTYTLKNVDQVSPGGVAVIYTLIGRV
jgi:hypothetical protein